jgi:uncharacterized protein
MRQQLTARTGPPPGDATDRAGAQQSAQDRVGLGWRGALAAGIYAHLDRLDVLEVLADSHFHASRRQLRSLRALGREVPILCHGVGLGLASVSAVDTWRIQRLARVLEALQPESWSEHLAFVRSGGHEIGHLAAPPRTLATVEGAVRNLAHIRRVVGEPPALENIATLIDPPASVLTEAAWISAIAQGADASLLLDLHNLHANCVNFGHSAHEVLRALPLGRVRLVHLSGGRMIHPPGTGVPRLLDDHLHDVPEVVYTLLSGLARLCPHPLTVIIERDGRFPQFPVLLAQVQRARQALAAGRQQAALACA